MAPEFKAGMRFLGVGGNRAVSGRKIGGTPGDEREFLGQIEVSKVAEEWGDTVLEPVAGDVGHKQLVADLLRLNTGQMSSPGESVENRKPDASHARPQIEAAGGSRCVLERVPGGGGVVDGVPVPAFPLKNTQGSHQAADENLEPGFLFQAGFSGQKSRMKRGYRGSGHSPVSVFRGICPLFE
jgi:hypothetical protein